MNSREFFDVQIRVGYKDTDKMGVVHHSNYVVFYEIARTEWLRSKGYTYRELEEKGVMMPVREIQSKFLRPAFYDDLLTVRISVQKMGGVRVVFYHEIFNQGGELIHTGTAELAFMDAESRRPCRAPEWFVEMFGAK